MTAMKQAKKDCGRQELHAGGHRRRGGYKIVFADSCQNRAGSTGQTVPQRADAGDRHGNIVQQHPARKRARVFPQARQRRRNVHNTPGCGLLSGRRRLLSGQSGERHKGRAGRGKGPVQHLAGGDGLPMHPIPGKFTGKTYLRRRHTGSVYAPMEKTLSRK